MIPKTPKITEKIGCDAGLYRLSLAVIFAAVARLLMTLIVFYHSFPPRFQGNLENIWYHKGFFSGWNPHWCWEPCWHWKHPNKSRFARVFILDFLVASQAERANQWKWLPLVLYYASLPPITLQLRWNNFGFVETYVPFERIHAEPCLCCCSLSCHDFLTESINFIWRFWKWICWLGCILEVFPFALSFIYFVSVLDLFRFFLIRMHGILTPFNKQL